MTRNIKNNIYLSIIYSKLKDISSSQITYMKINATLNSSKASHRLRKLLETHMNSTYMNI